MAIFVQPTLPSTITVEDKPAAAAYTITVSQARPLSPFLYQMLAYGPLQPPDIDGRYCPPLILFVG